MAFADERFCFCLIRFNLLFDRLQLVCVDVQMAKANVVLDDLIGQTKNAAQRVNIDAVEASANVDISGGGVFAGGQYAQDALLGPEQFRFGRALARM